MSRLLASLCLAVAFTAVSAEDGKRKITQKDLLAFRWIADPQMSPDGSHVVYTRVQVNTKGNDYETQLWIVPVAGGSERALTSGARDSAPRWSPDGRFIAFLRAGEKDGKPQPPQIHLLPMQGGEARALTDLPKGSGVPVWSPDGRRIAFTSVTNAGDVEKKPAANEDEPSDVRVITRAVYRSNGTGYNDYERPSHIWTIDIPAEPGVAAKTKQHTAGHFSETDPVWSRDGLKLFFVSNRTREPYYAPADSDVYAVSASAEKVTEPERVASIDGAVGGISVSPDGTRVAFTGLLTGKPETSFRQPDLFVARLDNGAVPRNLTTQHDFDINAGLAGDQHPPKGGQPSKMFWSRDGRYVHAIAARQGTANLLRFDTETGDTQPLTKGEHEVFGYTASADGLRVAVLVSTPTVIGDVYLVESGTLRRLTNTNDELFSKLHLTEPEMIWYDSFDKRRIQTWVQRPPDFDASKKYPLILNIHGGPHAAYGYTFVHEFQWMAAKGYIVLYPNPRGSSTYGQEFGNVIQYRYPGDDHKDLMAGVDELIKRGWGDPERLGITGGSGGGILTNWAIAHTDRFKAAVSQRSIADWRDLWYTSDFSLFTQSWFRGAPWTEEADFKARSPITYVERVKTPLMLIEGEADLRTPPGAGGEQMFRALKYRRVPTVMVQFPTESHELSRSGKPRHRIERLEHIVAWFDKWVLGQDIRTYDIP